METRPAALDDAPDLLALSNAVDRDWWGRDETDPDEITERLQLAGDLTRCTRVVAAADRIVGSVVAFGSHDTEMLIAPELAPALRRRVEDELLGWLTTTDRVRVEAPAQATDHLAALARHGFLPRWSSFDMERAPTTPSRIPDLPHGVRWVPFDRDRQAPAVHAMLYRFWTEVPSHHHRDLAEWQELFLDPAGSDPELQLVAWRDADPIGVAICRVFTGDTGWISQLGVVPEERGSGLGRALLVGACARLGSVPGVTSIGLSVVARNVRALELYRSAGFAVTREWVSCERST